MLALTVELCAQRRFGYAGGQQIHGIQHTVRSQCGTILVVRDLVGIVGGACTAFAQEQVFITAGDRANGVQNKGRDIKQLFVIFHRAGKVFPARNSNASTRGDAGFLQQGG